MSRYSKKEVVLYVATFVAAVTLMTLLVLFVTSALRTQKADNSTQSPTSRVIVYDKPYEEVEDNPSDDIADDVNSNNTEAKPSNVTADETGNTRSEPTQNASDEVADTSSFKSDGVWSDNNYRYTWYSSNALRHYRTDEWTAGEDGIYRDVDGYVVVASSDLAQGTVVEDTPFGDCKVYDSGCASGTIDVYTNF